MSTPKSTILKELKAFCGKYDTYALAAKALKVTAAQLSQTLGNKNNVIPERILKKLGYKSEIAYVKVGGKKAATRKIARDAESGEIVTPEFAAANPKTTVVETVKVVAKPADFIDVTEKV